MPHGRKCLSWIWMFPCTLVSLLSSVDAAGTEQQIRQLPAKAASPRVIAGTVVVGDVDTRTLRSALDALPRRPERIVMVSDDALPPAVRRQMRDLDGFVPTGSRTIYLRQRSVTVRDAEFSGGPYR
jgi:hypothetical protein